LERIVDLDRSVVRIGAVVTGAVVDEQAAKTSTSARALAKAIE
jgi:hypothetical protein